MKSVVLFVSKHVRYRNGFTLVEVAAATVLLGLLIASSLTLTNRYIDTVADMQLRGKAFEIARSNMEQLLSENTLPEMDEYGVDEIFPELDWETMVEPFYEPVTDRMWIRAVCSAGFTDSRGERQDVEMEHWITNLTPEQIRLIRAQQKAEAELMKLMQGGELTEVQKATVAFMLQEGLDVDAYRKFIKKQLRRKMEFLSENSMYDNAYLRFCDQLEAEENVWLENHGFDFDAYDIFIQDYDPTDFDPAVFNAENNSPGLDPADAGMADDTSDADSSDDPLDFLPPEFLGGG